MVYAARKGNITKVRAAITAGGDVNYCQSDLIVSQYTHTHTRVVSDYNAMIMIMIMIMPAYCLMITITIIDKN